MKRFIATLAAASVFTVVPVVPSPALAADNPGNTQVVDHCQTTTAFPNETIGNCVALLTGARLYFSGTGDYGFIAQIFSFFMKSRPDDFYAVYDSYNECILDAATQLP